MRQSANPATLRDVAAECGLSISTVSRALRTPELLNKETLRIVTEAIEKLHYRPSITAQTLRGDRTRVVLVVVPSLSPFFLDVFSGAEEAAAAAGYSVLVANTDRRCSREHRLLEQAAVGSVDGVILVTSTDLPKHSLEFASQPVVIALDVSSETAFSTVRVDHVAAAAEATRYLIELGHRDIAHIKGPASSGMSAHRLQGFRMALEESAIPFDADLCFDGAFTVESGIAAVDRMLSGSKRPSAIFAANDQMAIGAAQRLRQEGLRIPEDISLIGFDDERMAALYDPPLSTVRIPTFDIGHGAMVQLLRLLDGETADQDTVLNTELTVRKSTGPNLKAA
jgi:LacI family repressor for deo operon, udp, cdd, tsx, nupC, and nupG